MDNAKENEDELAHPSGTDMTIHRASSSQPVPMDQDNPIPSDNTGPSSQTDAASNRNSIVELNSTSPQSQPEQPSTTNISESKSCPRLCQTETVHMDYKVTVPQQTVTEAVTDSKSAELKTSAQPLEDVVIPNDGNEGLRCKTEQHQIESCLRNNNAEFNDGLEQSPINVVPDETRPENEATPNDKGVDLKPCPQQSGYKVELKSGAQQCLRCSSSPAPSDNNVRLLMPQTESPAEGKTKPNGVSDCKPEACGVNGISNSISKIETPELIVDSKSEPSEVPENKPSHRAGTVPKKHNEPAMLNAESASIKNELENKRELKNGDNEMDSCTPRNNGDSKNSFLLESHDDGNESASEEEQWAFMKELEKFFRERSMEFKPPKFYGEGLNCLKLWRSVMRLGGYDKVTSCKLWRQVGESFKPPKTCTTVSWTFRGFYEKALLDYERHKTCGGELSLPLASNSEPMTVDNQTPGLGRARRDSAARAMQGWHSQRLLGNGEVSDAIIKDKNSVPLQKHEKQHKSVGLLKRKKPSFMENAVKAARSKTSKPQLDVEVVDLGSPADWVKVNVQRTKDCFEVYALVPGLLREEVRVQSDPAGRLVISGEPEHPDNPWGVTPFKKVVNLPSRIDPHQTSAVVTLHGQLFVRVPFEHSD